MTERAAVMLSDDGAEDPVAAELARRAVKVDCYARMDRLFAENPPGTIPVLLFHVRERPKGRVLEVIGRLQVEFPRVQVAVLNEAPLSLDVMEYLAGRGVDVVSVGPGADCVAELSSVVERMHERRQRSLAVC
jgi:hypothetical protein